MSTLEKRFEKWMKSQGLEYLRKGWPDYAVYGKNEIKFVEVKKPHEQLKPHQMRMHRILHRLGMEVKIAIPSNNGFELKESSFVEFDKEDFEIVERLLNYKRFRDKLLSLGIILESWAEKHNLAKPKTNLRLGNAWIAIVKEETKKPYNQPNFYVSFSDRITGSLHVEVGLHFRDVNKTSKYSENTIERLRYRKKDFLNLIQASDELNHLELFLAEGTTYRKLESLKLSNLKEQDIEGLTETYQRHKDVRVIFAKVYTPEEVTALEGKFSEKITQVFESLHRISDFLIG